MRMFSLFWLNILFGATSSAEKILVDEAPNDKVDDSDDVDGARTFVPETETMNVETDEKLETKDCVVNVTDVLLDKKEADNVEENLDEAQTDVEDAHESNEMETNDVVVDNPASADAAISDIDSNVESDDQSKKGEAIEGDHQPGSSKDEVDVDDIFTLMDDETDFEQLSAEKLKIAFDNCNAHRRKLANNSEKIAHILFRKPK